MSIQSFAKSSLKKPWVLGAIVIAGGVGLFLIMRQGGASSGSMSVYGQSEASQIANAQLGLQGAQIQAQQNVAALGAQASVRMAELEAGVAENAIAAQLAVMLAQNQSAENVATLANNNATNLASYNISVQQQMYNTGQEYAFRIVQDNNDLSQVLGLREFDFLQFREREITDRNQEDNWTQRHADYAPQAESFLGNLFGFLSDVRTKHNIVWLGISDNGLNRYSWQYIGRSETCYGHMTQEAELLYPGLVSTDPASGYQMLNYGGIA